MGFLSGAYGKLMAGKYLRSLQHRETMVQARLRRVTKQVGDMEKYLTRMEKQVNANMQRQYQMNMMSTGIFGNYDFFGNSGGSSLGNVQLTDEQRQNFMVASQFMQNQMMQAQNVWAQEFDMIRESMLTPLKDEEDSIQTELDSIKSQIQLAQAEYDAKKEEEKAGAKNIAPDYTGQG